jgi:hypothetical protein
MLVLLACCDKVQKKKNPRLCLSVKQEIFPQRNGQNNFAYQAGRYMIAKHYFS